MQNFERPRRTAKNLSFIILTFTISVFFNNPVFSEIYKYVDNTGKRHFTNDASSIPSQYRTQIEIIGEIEHSPIIEETPLPTAENTENIATENQSAGVNPGENKLPEESGDEKPLPKKPLKEQLKDQAWGKAQGFALNALKNPGSASFPERPKSIEEVRSYEWEIVSHVDCQNDFGALKRLYFKIVVAKDRADDNWHLVKFNYWH